MCSFVVNLFKIEKPRFYGEMFMPTRNRLLLSTSLSLYSLNLFYFNIHKII